MAVLDLGRIVVKTAGREATKKAIIVGFVDNNFVLVTGAGVNKVKRRRCNIRHLIATPNKIDINNNASDAEIKSQLEKANLIEEFNKEFD
ncbi:MAG: 50S ribosomal protein L14e [Candidatus Hodarchaeales archaeon]|jgi:large subunit ribosomal protein L14e